MEYERIMITGASSGLGEAFARTLAGSKPREMVLIARRRERLEALAGELRTLHPELVVQVAPCDLASPAARAELLEQWSALPPARTLLINNAGLGDYGDFASSDPTKTNSLLQVNMLAVVELTRALLPQMLRCGGSIINIASLAADLPLPDFALYAASKSFVASFSEGLRLELRGSGVRVLAVCPGPVHTEFGSVAQRPGLSKGSIPLKKFFYTSIPQVVQSTLRALAAGRARCYPGGKIWLSGCLLRLMPLWLLRRILSTRPRRVAPIPTDPQA